MLGLEKKNLALAGAITAVGVAAGVMAVASVRKFAAFDEKMTESLAIMGNVSGAMQGEMADAARQMGRTTVFSANQAAESYFFLASAGLNAEQSVAALPQVAAFAQAGMFDMARATDLATDAQSALGLTVDDTAQNLENMTRVTDVLVKANTLANASVEQFSVSLTSQAGAALKMVGKDIEEGVAVLAAFADQGVKAEKAGNALSRVTRILSVQAVRNADAYEDLGIAVFDADDEMRNFADIVEDLTSVLGPMADLQRTAALEALGFRAKLQTVILPLLGTSEAIRQYEAGLRDAGGTTRAVAQKQMETLNKQLGLLGSEFGDLVLGVGSFLTEIGKLPERVSGMVTAIRAARYEVGTFVQDFKRDVKIIKFWKDQWSRSFREKLGLPNASLQTIEEMRSEMEAMTEQVLPAFNQQVFDNPLLNPQTPISPEQSKIIRALATGEGMEIKRPLPPTDELPEDDEKKDEKIQQLLAEADAELALAEARRKAGERVADVRANLLTLERQLNAALRERNRLTSEQEAKLLQTRQALIETGVGIDVTSMVETLDEDLANASIPSVDIPVDFRIDPSEIQMPDVSVIPFAEREAGLIEDTVAQARELVGLTRARVAAGEDMTSVQTELAAAEERINALLAMRPQLTTEQETALLNARAALTDAGAGAAEDLKEPFVDALPAFRQLGADLIRGIGDGTFDAGEFLKNTAITLLSNFFLGPLGSFLGIASPSRVTAEMGRETVRGFSVGIVDEARRGTIAQAWRQAVDLSAPEMQPEVTVRRPEGEDELAEQERRERLDVEATIDADRVGRVIADRVAQSLRSPQLGLTTDMGGFSDRLAASVVDLAATTASTVVADRRRAEQTQAEMLAVMGRVARPRLRIALDGMPPAKDPRQAARDRDWQDFIRESLEVREADGGGAA